MRSAVLSMAGVLALASGTVAQIDHVVPTAYAATTGTGAFTGQLANAARTYQWLIHSDQLVDLVGADLTALTYRLPASAAAAYPAVDATYTNYDIRISPGVEPALRSLTFANNVAGVQQLVRSGSLTIPAGSFTNGSSPNAFGHTITFTTPYSYGGGHLLVELRHNGPGTTNQSVDALVVATPGYATQFSACWTGSYTGTAGTQANFGVLRFTGTGGAPTGRCCKTDGTCLIASAAGCAGQGGTYAGDGTNCTPNVCPQPPTGRCCFFSGTCSVLTQAQCTTQGGTYAGDGSNCTPNVCPPPPPAGVVHAINVRDGAVNARQFITFPVNAPAYNLQGSTSPDTFAMDFDETGTNLYAITFVAAGAHQLGTVDQVTGVFTSIATISGAAGAEANIGGMTFDNSNDTMYALGTAAGLNNIYTVNLATGVTTLVAPVTGLPAGAVLIHISMNNTGTQLVGHEIIADQMWSINKATGVATLLGPTGFLANFAQGMDFDPVSGNLYATLYVGGGVGSFVRVNTTTGACTALANTQPWTVNGPEMEMAIKGVGGGCYANCDGSTGTPVLTANDFQCFLNKYAASDPLANCDGSTGVPALTANDFQCFLNKYAAGCS